VFLEGGKEDPPGAICSFSAKKEGGNEMEFILFKNRKVTFLLK
jgi:hypothetical protein